jgi:hypothetical protein
MKERRRSLGAEERRKKDCTLDQRTGEHVEAI